MTKLEKATNTNLKKISEMIKRGELLLPDFQRGFVWKEEMQISLIASVLAKMPIGSILLLEATVSDYGCRVLGRKDEPETGNRNPNESIYVLLDGQQRLTVLENVFSNLLYYDYSGSGMLDCDYKKLISTDLQNRFFLEIPAVDHLAESEDIFHLKSLNFFLENPEGDTPDFLTGDIAKYIKRYKFSEGTQEPFAPHTDKPYHITNYCIQNERYLIPLYLLIGDDSSETRLKTILKSIVEKVVQYRLEKEYDILQSESEKQSFIEKYIERDYIEEISTAEANGKKRRDVLEKKWTEMGETHWADRMKRYLMSCVNHLDLHQIIVDASNRNRAIDIYENLNLGGIALSTADCFGWSIFKVRR